MVQLTRIYTRGGDKGRTSLGNGKRVFKNSLRMEAIGAVDEVNSWIGVCRLYVKEELDEELARVQNDLFDLGGDLCIPEKISKKKALRVQSSQTEWLEQRMDEMNLSLAPLTSFILPGGSVASSFCHVARTVTRRAERVLVHLGQVEKINPESIKYMNRLSDYLFVVARFLNKEGAEDVLWVPGHYQKA